MLRFLLDRTMGKLKRRYQEALGADDPHKMLLAAEEAIELANPVSEWPVEYPSRAKFFGRMHGARGMALRGLYDPSKPKISDAEIDAWQRSITHLEREPDEDLVISYRNAAVAVFEHPAGDRTGRIETAIEYINKAINLSMNVRGSQIDPFLLLDRSRFYAALEMPKNSVNLQLAIADNEQALNLFDEGTPADRRAMAVGSLAALYFLQGSGDRAANTERAIRILEDEWAQKSKSLSAEVRWAILTSLASMYMDNPSGLPADNIEYALVQVEESLIEAAADRIPEHRAHSHELLGHALARRVRGEELLNLKRARDAYSEAKFGEWGSGRAVRVAGIELKRQEILRRISRLEADRAQPSSSESSNVSDQRSSKLSWVEYARRLEAATAKISRDVEPETWADGRSALGDVLLQAALLETFGQHQFSEAGQSMLNRVVNCYHEALEVWQEKAKPAAAAHALASIAKTYRLAYWFSEATDHGWSDFSRHYVIDPSFRSERTLQFLNRSIEYAETAINTATSTAAPLFALSLQCGLAEGLMASRRWSDASQVFSNALRHAATLLSDPIPGADELRETLEHLGKIAGDAPFASVMAGRSEDAVRMLEASQAQLLARALTLLQLPLSDAERMEVARLRSDILALEHRLASQRTFDRRTPLESLIGKRAGLRRLLSSTTSDFAARLAPYDILRRLTSNGQIVVIPVLCTLGGRLLVFSDERGELRQDQVDIADLIDLGSLVDKRGTLRRAWHTEINDNRGLKLDTAAWQARLDETRSAVSRSITEPLAGILERVAPNEAASLHIITHHVLNALPLNVSRTDQLGRPLIEHFNISYSPSLLTTQRCMEAANARIALPASIATVCVEHDPNDQNSLRHAPIEAGLVCSWLRDRSDVRIGKAAVPEQQLLKQIDGAEIWHFSAHGEFNADAPMESRIVLGQSQLSLRTLFDAQGLSPPRYVVLSACDTALTARRELPHELIGLPSALLQLGAQGVIATQWPVSDIATTLLMGRLYQYMVDDSLAFPQALRRAQFWLRDATKESLTICLTGWTSANRLSRANADRLLSDKRIASAVDGYRVFQHPIYWGAFCYFGA